MTTAPTGLFDWDMATQNETILFGLPSRVRERMARLIEASGCDYVVCSFFSWGTIPQEQMLRSAPLRAHTIDAFGGRE
jgi:hypothetical protein